MTMGSDEFISGQSIMRIMGDAYEYSTAAGSRIMLPVGGLHPRDELLRNLAADVFRRCADEEARRDITSPSGLRLLCRTALQREKDGAMIFVGTGDDSAAEVITLFSGRMPSKSRLLAAAKELFDNGRYTCGALAHSFADTDGLTDAIYANELYQLAVEAGINFRDYLVFLGIDCYSVRDQYRDFWE